MICPRSLIDITDDAVVATGRQFGFHRAVNAIDLAEDVSRAVAGRVKIIVGPRKLLAGDWSRQIGRDDYHQFGFVADEIPAAEQRTEDRNFGESRKAGN